MKVSIFMKTYAKYIFLFAAIACIAAGMYREETSVVLNKAIRICLECIGVG